MSFKFFNSRSLNSRLISWFLLISLLPLVWIAFISYEFSKKLLLEQATHNLKGLSLRQSQLVENYFRDKERNTISLAQDLTIIETLKQLNAALKENGKDSSEYRDTQDIWGSNVAIRAENLGYRDIFLIDLEGNIVFSIKLPDTIGENLLSTSSSLSSLKNLYLYTLNFLDTRTSNLIYFNDHLPPASFVSTPILEDNQLIGILMAEIDNEAIYQLVNDYTGLGKTGETILVTEIQGQLLSIAPLRNTSKPLQAIPKQSDFGAFILELLNGNRIITTVLDNQGHETLMVGRYFLPSLDWGIITKMDMSEILAPIDKLRLLSLIMVLATAGIVILAASSVAKAITYPIEVLTRKTRLMAEGDLSQRINIQSDDEIGKLGLSFNELGERLDTTIHNLDSIVAQRTQQVESQNSRLERTIHELEETQNRLINQEKLASLGALTAGIAHEIKNPLNFINNFAELSMQTEQEMEELFQKVAPKLPTEEGIQIKELFERLHLNIKKIYEHGKRADNIIYSMLQHSRSAPGEKVPTDLNALLDEYVALSYHGMRAQDHSFNVKIEKKYDTTIPQLALVRQEISRVFLNLLNNAYYSVNQKKKSMEENSSYTPIVRVTTQYVDDLVMIKIWDNGKGIPKEVFPKLFVPFFTTKPMGEGTGLGLSLSYNIIVREHNGTLTVNSEDGEFAEFIIQLPIETKP